MEVGRRLTPDLRQSRPADVLMADWERGRPVAWNVTVTSPLTPALLNEATPDTLGHWKSASDPLLYTMQLLLIYKHHPKWQE